MSDEDLEFVAELRALDRSDDWKRFAIVGRMMAQLWVDRTREAPLEPGGRPAEDVRAWRWGFEWTPGGPPPLERPEGACPKCWRLGEPCQEHYR